MTKPKALGEFMIMAVTVLAIFHAGKSIIGSVERQVFLHQQQGALEHGQVQAQQINKELRDGLKNYRSSSGIERLARERLNLAGPDEVVVRITKQP
ncbi:MAG: septum formation initiator family protein [Candidatus Obscuribacterales bacterium]